MAKWGTPTFSCLFQLHILISGGIQLGLLVVSMMLLIGIARRVKCLFIPWLLIFGLTQMVILGSVLACVIYLPSDFKVNHTWYFYLLILKFFGRTQLAILGSVIACVIYLPSDLKVNQTSYTLQLSILKSK
jgi:hypothetical protein